jgi:hypothetical protein
MSGIAVLLALLPLTAARGDVVINEILYNAPDDRDDVQWIELHNTGARSVDLGDWTLDEGKSFTFPAGTRIEARGFLVVALDPEPFSKIYKLPAIGPLKRPLRRGGERIELRDSRRKRVDVARYKDREPWPVSADGYSASLERICPSAPGDLPANWAGSPLPPTAPQPAGTPGKPNVSFSPVLPPVISAVRTPSDDLLPGRPLPVEAEVKDRSAPREVALLYRVITAGVESKEAAVPMVKDRATGRFQANIPAQRAGALVRYRIRAVGKTGAQRLYPAENDLRPTLSAYTHETWEPARIPFGLILRTGADRSDPAGADPLAGPRPFGPGGFGGFGNAPRGPRPGPPPGGLGEVPGGPRRNPPPGEFGGGRGPGRGGPPGGFRGEFMRRAPAEPRPPRGASAFIYVDPKSGRTTLFDHVNVVSRDRGPMYRGYKVFFHKDRTLNGMSAVNLVLERSEWSLMPEILAYDLYRRAGSAAPLSEFVRLWVDGRLAGYHLMVERPNRSFLRRNRVNDEGNLYKLIWYGRDIVDKHDKKTNTQAGHEDLLALIDQLQKTRGDEQWKIIQENFNVDQVATYFAVNTILSHWDGFFNNYFAYHDTRGTQKWEIYPWDQDNTWGLQGFFRGDVFFDMPLTFGMDGDRPPGAPDQPVETGQFRGFGGPFGRGGPMWWRPPGYFSGPLLANPQFRKIFLARTREILERAYTPEIYFPLIEEMADRLREDVILRARARGQDADSGTRALARHVEMLKSHLVKRRQFLLEQAELRAAGPGAGTQSEGLTSRP